MIKHDVIIIGGGASGLTAALIAAEYGKDVAILEAENRIGRKIITTGNGRCNISNAKIKAPYPQFHSSNEGFYEDVLNQFTVDDTTNLFLRLGLPLVELNKGKLYPQSLQASSVVDLLRLNLEERGVITYIKTKVVDMIHQKDGFMIYTNNEKYPQFEARFVVAAAGGIAAPDTGSDGSMDKVIKKLGHRVLKQLPSIVQLKLDYPHLKAISGTRFNALAKVLVNKEVVRTDYDEVLFTEYGISGPAILQISRNASVHIDQGDSVHIELDLFPEQEYDEISEWFDNHFNTFYYRSLTDSLNGVIHKRLIPILLKDAGIDHTHKLCESLTTQEKMRFIGLLKGWRFTCTGTNGFKNAQTTVGGIDTTDVNPHTLESTIVPNLFLCGESLDVDGDCGGFNLQWAWSSGYVCGVEVGKRA